MRRVGVVPEREVARRHPERLLAVRYGHDHAAPADSGELGNGLRRALEVLEGLEAGHHVEAAVPVGKLQRACLDERVRSGGPVDEPVDVTALDHLNAGIEHVSARPAADVENRPTHVPQDRVKPRRVHPSVRPGVESGDRVC